MYGGCLNDRHLFALAPPQSPGSLALGAELDALRAKRAQEQYEREWRKKEREEALRAARINQELPAPGLARSPTLPSQPPTQLWWEFALGAVSVCLSGLCSTSVNLTSQLFPCYQFHSVCKHAAVKKDQSS